MRGLLQDGRLVEPVTENTKGEDGRGEGIAGILRVPAKELCQDLVAVLWIAVQLAMRETLLE